MRGKLKLGIVNVMIFMMLCNVSYGKTLQSESGEEAYSIQANKLNTWKQVVRNLLNYHWDEEFTYKKSGENVLEINFYDEGLKSTVVFGPNGTNCLYSVYKIGYAHQENQNELKSLKSSSDWISPYIMAVVDGENQPYIKRFTGGGHGSNGDDTGDRTAYTKDVVITIDGIDYRQSNNSGRAHNINIIVTNEVKACNSDGYELEEQVCYHITNGKIKVSVRGKAYRNLVIHRYYGLQSINRLWKQVKYHYNDQTVSEGYGSCEESRCKARKEGCCRYLEVINDDMTLEVHITRGIGFGNYAYIDDDQPTCFTKDYGKSYFNLVNGKPLMIKKDHIFSWEGYYLYRKTK